MKRGKEGVEGNREVQKFFEQLRKFLSKLLEREEESISKIFADYCRLCEELLQDSATEKWGQLMEKLREVLEMIEKTKDPDYLRKILRAISGGEDQPPFPWINILELEKEEENEEENPELEWLRLGEQFYFKKRKYPPSHYF